MTTLWSPTPPTFQKPGGIAWIAESFAHVTAVLQKLVVSGAGLDAYMGTLAAVEKKLIASINGTMPPAGGVAAPLHPLTAALVGAQAQSGVVASALKLVTALLAGGQTDPGTIAAAIPMLRAALQAGQAQQGAITAGLQKVSASIVGTMPPAGIITAAIPGPPIVAITGVMPASGTMSVVLAKPVASIAGAQGTSGTVTAVAKQLLATLAAGQADTGTIGALLIQAAAALAGNVGAAPAGGVAFDAVGDGFINESTTTSMPFNSNASAGAWIFVFISVADYYGHQAVTSVTCGGTPMALWEHVYPYNNSGYGDSYCYFVPASATANPQIVVTTAANTYAVASSISYTGVGSFSTIPSVYGNTATLPNVVASPTNTGDVVVNMYGGQITPVSSPVGGNLRINKQNVAAAGLAAVIVADSNAASTTFGATSGAPYPDSASITLNLTATPQPMILGTAVSATTTVGIPAHNPGDLIVIISGRASNTLPTKPSPAGTVPAWTLAYAPAGANTVSQQVYYFVATASNHTSGTWTSASRMSAIVIAAGTFLAARPFGAVSGGSHASSSSQVAPAETLEVAGGTSLVLRSFVSGSSVTYNAAPAGYSLLTSGTGLGIDIQANNTAAAAETRTTSAASAYSSFTLEIFAAKPGVPIFDAVATGVNAGAGGTGVSWTHTPLATFTGVLIVDVCLDKNNIPTGVTCDGVAMTNVASVNLGTRWGGNANHSRWKLENVSFVKNTGKAIVATQGGTTDQLGSVSASYMNVSSVGASTATAVQNTTTPTQPVTCGAGQRVVQGFGSVDNGSFGSSFSAPTGGINRTVNNGAPWGLCSLSDTTAASDTFGITISNPIPSDGISTLLNT